jgi:hypothetical protein
VLLGAGASRAALPEGDRRGRPVPLLRDVADDLGLAQHFPEELRELAASNFEDAYSQLHDRAPTRCGPIDDAVRAHFAQIELPDEPNLYDVLTLSLRSKDVICTFNWDPFLLQSRIRLAALGCRTCHRSISFTATFSPVSVRLTKRWALLGRACSRCGEPFEPSPLLYPVEHKNYADDGFIDGEWTQVRHLLKDCFMLTVFGYSAPATDVEAIELLSQGWDRPEERQFEQT